MDDYRVNELSKNLRFFGNIENPDYSGKVVDSTTFDILYLDMKIDKNGYIIEVKYNILTKPLIYAICELISEKIINNNIKNIAGFITQEYVEKELGDIPQDSIFVIELFKHAFNEIQYKYNVAKQEKKEERKKQQPEPQFRRILNFDDEDDDPDILTPEQVRKLLDAVEDLNTSKKSDRAKRFEMVRQDVIGKKQPIINPIRPVIKEKLAQDNIPDFSDYNYDSDNLIFEQRDFEERNFELDLNSIQFEEDIDNREFETIQEREDFDEPDTEFESGLNFSSYEYNFPDKIKIEEDDEDK